MKYRIAGNFCGFYISVKSLIKIFADKILRMANNEVSFHLKMMLSSEFPHAKFLLLIDHPKFPAIRYYIDKLWV